MCLITPTSKSWRSKVLQDTESIMRQLEVSGDSSVGELQESDLDVLRISLARRLGISPETLDYAPESLSTLENAIKAYCNQVGSLHMPSKQNELGQFIREQAAYFGSVVEKNLHALWYQNGSLVRTCMVVTTTARGKPLPRTRYQFHNLVNILAANWDITCSGRTPALQMVFQSIRRRNTKRGVDRNMPTGQ